MLRQTSLPNEDAISQRSSRFLWSGFGFAVLVLIGISACVLLSTASQASPKLPHHVAMVAFYPSLPVLGPAGTRRATADIREGSMTSKVLAEENKDHRITPGEVQHGLGKMAGSLQTSSVVMTTVLDPPKVRSSQFSKQTESARAKLERQFAQPPTPPPPPNDGDGDGGREGTFLRHFSVSEVCMVLDDWIKDVRVTSVNTHLPPMRSRTTLQQLESFRLYIEDGSADPNQLVYGLFNQRNNRLLAIAGGSVIPAKTLTAGDCWRLLVTAGEHYAAGACWRLLATASHIPHDTIAIKYISALPSVEKRASDQRVLAMKQALGDLAKHPFLTVVFENVNR